MHAKANAEFFIRDQYYRDGFDYDARHTHQVRTLPTGQPRGSHIGLMEQRSDKETGRTN